MSSKGTHAPWKRKRRGEAYGTLYAHGPKGNEFPGNVKGVQIDLEKDDHDDLISPVDHFKIAMAQQ